MVCLSMDGPFLVMIKDEYGGATTSVVSACGMIQLSSTKSIESIFSEICSQYKYSQDSIALILENRSGEKICLNDHKDKTLEQIGVSCGTSTHNSITIQALNKCDAAISSGVPPDNYSEYELQLGASASPTGAGVDDILPSSSCDPPPTLMSDDEYSETSRDISTSRHNLHRAVLVDSLNYVGLVNQAMTCYLNSLLQALYMTPEFRNALYNWEFDGQNEARSIPFQLQKLFLNLQTSLRSAVETTELTHSFGWQGSDAWQQHDIQELCRVMFDALEQKFKSTRQANLISELYEGKMLDYVRCLECGTEKSREDTFLDIPLPVRPFGASGAYASVEEALRAFVQPETLDGNNQYHCDTCRKKCDAHKGLKFTKFPYLLTLHLKRFDFDYNTLHRIKLNDKVVFPYKLNLNSFTHACDTAGSVHRGEGDTDPTRGVCDDCSTTDSGSALDDDTSCQGTDASGSSVVNGHDVDNCGGDSADEGIDVSSGGTTHENEASGPYLYELFSIMIHSGSASGGHYYAYIKDFDKNQWFCFNDQSVSRITEEDIRKTYGGGPARSFYTGAYTSSTNAYMLMYRQINKERNCRAISAENFPPHIQNLLKQMRHKEEQDRINREKENDMIKLTVYIIHPTDSTLRDARISVGMDWTLGEGAHSAYSRFQLENIVALEDCRLVTYNKFQECINMSYDNVDDVRFSDVRKSGLKRVSFRNAGAGNSDALVPVTNWMLEIRQPGTEWETYKEGGINMRVVPINIESEDVEEGFSVRVNMNETVAQLKHRIAAKLEADPSTLKLVMENVCKFSHDLKYLEQDDSIIDYDISDTYKLYVSNALDEDPAQNFENCRLRHLIERFKHVIMLNVMLPNTNTETLENLSIPSLELRENLDRLELASEGGNCSPPIRGSPQPPSSDGPSDQSNSNSEDSSLSDSDRTLVGDAPGESLAQLSPSSLSPGDHPMASPSDEPYRPTTGPTMGPAGEEMHWDDEDSGMSESTSTTSTPSYFFKVTLLLPNLRCARLCRVLVDQRMTIERFKKHLETFVTVPVDYFKVFSYTHTSEDECTNNSLLRLHKDGARLSVKLGRVLRKDEYNAKVYYLNIETSTEMTVLLEHIIAKGQTVEQVKKQIMYQAKKQHGLDLSPHKCRLREKSWKKPKLVFLDQQVFGDDIPLFKHFELILQELSEPEKVFNTDQVPIFTRQWHPATLTLGPYREVVFDNSTMTLESFKEILSNLEGIPVENLEVAYVKNNFPADMHVLEVDSELEWISTAAKDDEMYLGTDGHIFFFRDNREKPKELTADERKELNSKENKRLGRSIKSYSPGRERALKIYLDTSPCKTDYTD